MKTLVYKVIFRLNTKAADEKIYNDGFVVVFLNKSNEIIRMEGLLTDDYLIAEIIKDNLLITMYSSYTVESIYSLEDLKNLDKFSQKSLDIYWEGYIRKDEIEFPFSFYFENKYITGYKEDTAKEILDDYDSLDLDFDEILDDDNFEYEYDIEKAELIATEKISKEHHKKYIQLLSEFKEKHVLTSEEWN